MLDNGTEFFYKRGNVSTTRLWTRPTEDKIVQFLDYALPKTDAANLDLYISGRCLIDVNSTTDLDMIAFGDINDQSLENLLHDLLDYSLNDLGILLDMAWSDQVSRFDEIDGKYYLKENTLKFLNPWQIIKNNVYKLGDTLSKKKGSRLTDSLAEVYITKEDIFCKKYIEALALNKDYFGIPARQWLEKCKQ